MAIVGKKYEGWTLFLDRDGVINKRLEKRYVQDWEEFEFLPGVLESIPKLNKLFSHIFVITNQRGIGLQLMTVDQLEAIHIRMLHEIRLAGGHIDKIYYCSKTYDEIPNCRKPDPYMAIAAKKDFPATDFNKSIMLGDQPSDIEFGNNLGMRTVWIPNHPGLKWEENAFVPDMAYSGLNTFTQALFQ